MTREPKPETTPDRDAISIDEIETALCCPRRHQYAHRQSIATQTRQDAIDRRTRLYRDVLTATLERADEPTESVLTETAMACLADRLDERSDPRIERSRQRRYDEASIRNAIETYIADHGTDHAAGAIAVGETESYQMDGYTVECPVDCFWSDGQHYEIARFVTTLDGIVWENPYSDPVSGYRDQEEFYPRQVGSILRAYATIHAVAAAHDVDARRIQYRYYAIAEETYPGDGNAGGTNTKSGTRTDTQASEFSPTIVTASRDVTDTCWEAGDACDEVLAATAGTIAAENWDPTGDRWEEIRSRSCRYCPYQSMCLDAINEAVRF